MIDQEYLDWLKELLYSEKDNAISLEFKEVNIGSWSPQLNMCHKNAIHYVANTDNCFAVFGWLVKEYATKISFIAHTVVRHKDGKPFDITPLNSTPEENLKFLRASISLNDYDALLEHNVTTIHVEKPESQ